jgi:hypothetical protein
MASNKFFGWIWCYASVILNFHVSGFCFIVQKFYLNVPFDDRSVGHTEIGFLRHSDEQTRVNDAGDHLDGSVDFVKVCLRGSFEEPVEQEIAVVRDTWTCFRYSHSQLEFATEEFLDAILDGNVSHGGDFDGDLLVVECEEFGIFCVVGDDDEVLGARSDNLFLWMNQQNEYLMKILIKNKVERSKERKFTGFHQYS